MQVEEAYERIREYKRPCQVFAYTKQDRAMYFGQVSVFAITDQLIASRRERDRYERFIGIFDFSKGYQLTLADFTAECVSVCEELRLADYSPKQLLQSVRARREDGLPDAERVEH